jgi:hypothetical protein
MQTIEKRALTSSIHLVGFYAGYIDDICFIASNAENGNQFHIHLNSINPAIQFEMEHPGAGNSLSLLDLKITLNEDSSLSTKH